MFFCCPSSRWTCRIGRQQVCVVCYCWKSVIGRVGLTVSLNSSSNCLLADNKSAPSRTNPCWSFSFVGISLLPPSLLLVDRTNPPGLVFPLPLEEARGDLAPLVWFLVVLFFWKYSLMSWSLWLSPSSISSRSRRSTWTFPFGDLEIWYRLR